MRVIILSIVLVFISLNVKSQSFTDKIANEAVVYYIQSEYDIDLSSEQKKILKTATLPLVVAYFEGRKIDRKTKKELASILKEINKKKGDFSYENIVDSITVKMKEIID